MKLIKKYKLISKQQYWKKKGKFESATMVIIRRKTIDEMKKLKCKKINKTREEQR